MNENWSEDSRILTDLTIHDRTKTIIFFLHHLRPKTCTLARVLQEVLTGIWSICYIFAYVGGENEIDVNQDKDKLTSSRQEKLYIFINSFPSFHVKGIGRTSLTTHAFAVGAHKSINITRAIFSVSPVIEELLYVEIDRILSLGVLQKLQFVWSSLVFLAVKPGIVHFYLDGHWVNTASE